ncbi:hypothetical protein GQ568_03155, partial [Patescibacteria group bacterium]|nr:hypothetical protein [Patescibacteria group bacterium]
MFGKEGQIINSQKKFYEDIIDDSDEDGLKEQSKSRQEIDKEINVNEKAVKSDSEEEKQSKESVEKGEKMQSNEVFAIIKSLESGALPELNEDEIGFLQERGLIDVKDTSGYEKMQQDTKGLNSANEQLRNSELSVVECKEKIRELEKELNSKWHKYLISKKSFENKESEFSTEKENLEELLENIKKNEKEKKRLEELKNEIGNYIYDDISTYIKLSSKGKERIKQLSVRQSRIKGVDYDEFEEEFELISQRIQAKYNKFKEMRGFLAKKDLIEGGSIYKDLRYTELAFSLSTTEENKEEMYEKVKVIDDYLFEKGYKEGDHRLKIISTVVIQEGDINELKNVLADIFSILVKNGYSNTISTLADASEIIKICGKTAQEKCERFDKMQNELTKKGWQEDNIATRYISINLMQKEGDEVEIANEFDALEKKITEKGIEDSIEAGIVAEILTNAQGTLDEKAERFIKTFKTMCKYKWGEIASDYTSAAIISLLPGTVEENV